MKTRIEWQRSGQDLSKFLQIGDEVGQSMYYYFLEVLPPACNSGRCLQIGEPYSHDNQGRPLFSTLTKTPGDKYWKYAGIMATPENETCFYID